MVESKDASLVKQCLEGNIKAFERLIDKHQKTVFNVALRIINDYAEAEDIAQTVFIRAYEKLASFDPKHKFFSWLYRMTVNESLNMLKQRKRTTGLDEGFVSSDKTPEENYEEDEMTRQIETALMRLDPEQRALIVLKHFQNMAYDEKRILRSLQPDRYAVHAKKPVLGGIRKLAEMLFGAPSYQLKYAYVFAFGLMAGLFIYALLSNTGRQQAAIDNSNLYGTMAWQDAAGDFEAADSMAADLEVGRASMQVKSSLKEVVAELHLNTIKEVKIRLEFDENDLGVSSISQSNSRADTAFSNSGHTLELTNLGENRYVIAFANKTRAASLLRFKLFDSGALQYETTLATAKRDYE